MANHKKPRGTRPQLAPRSNSSGARPRGLKPPRDSSTVDSSDLDPSMAQSFLPFCAHCEKQIVVPNTSILFCSEKCKRKDQARPPPIPIHEGVMSSALPCYNPYGMTPPHSQDFDDAVPPPKNYVRPFSPTRPAPFDEYALAGSMASIKLTTYTPTRPNSGAASPTDTSPYHPPRRPHHLRSATSGSISTISTTATTTTSHHTPIPVPTQYQQRPLPPRHRPHPFSSSPRSIDLVTPYISTPISPRADPITTNYQYPHSPILEERSAECRKSSSSRSSFGAPGNLKTLFNFDAIRGVPYTAEPVSAASPDKYLTYSNGTPILARMSPTSVHMK